MEVGLLDGRHSCEGTELLCDTAVKQGESRENSTLLSSHLPIFGWCPPPLVKPNRKPEGQAVWMIIFGVGEVEYGWGC